LAAIGALVGGFYRLALRELLPARCGACGRFGEFLCAGCRAAMLWADGPRCEACWQRSGRRLCPRCEEYGAVCSAIRACCMYDGPAKQVVLGVKYAGHHALAAVMAEVMAERWSGFGLVADVVVPVPLHPRRRRERGFNQAALLADGLGRGLALPLDAVSLRRSRPTPPQARSSGADERRANVFGAFTCAVGPLSGRRALLVDDVTTTGATFTACGTALLEAGVAAVYGYAFAIAS
jgi:ComF family protein